MANKPQIPTKNSALIAMIADEDTITGFLLAGVGDVDIRRKTNYLIVDNRIFSVSALFILPFRLQSASKLNWMFDVILYWCLTAKCFTCLETTVKQIEDAFKDFTTREDIAIVMISQYIANMIRFLVDRYNKPIPAILEIPSKDHPYDPAHDSVLSRVKYLFSAESVASNRY
ncbi:hypothetical protein Cgig2_021522 [Carnegiea gigantea]|uniref:V-type proton ATPase subunit F n=1 Tax=Carnegiea gigantea TaxID=171969 RepID=A0A9Q1KEL4_9CARY|nr:hypothetical protein Cgig2_021522 [Carnegiea gigantea]